MQAVTEFSTERPKSQRVYVVARDPDARTSKSVTLYGITPEKLVDLIRSLGESDAPKGSRRTQS